MHVTVLVTAYNRESLVGEALDSIIAQDYHDWDALVVDDGSTDDTAEVARSRMVDGRIKLIQMKHGGCAAATAMGIQHSLGPVITSLDSDDKLLADSLSTVLPAFESNPNLGYVWTNYVTSTGERGPMDFLPENKTLFRAMISGWWGAWCQRFFRKEFYAQCGGLDIARQYSVDAQLAFLMGKTGCDTLHIPKVTYWYRLHPIRISVEHFVEQQAVFPSLRRKFALESGNPELVKLYIQSILTGVFNKP